MLRFEAGVAVIEIRPAAGRKEISEITDRLGRMTEAGELQGIVLDFQGQDQLSWNLWRQLFRLQCLRRRYLRHYRQDHVFRDFIVFCNMAGDKFYPMKGQALSKLFPILDSVENGIDRITGHRKSEPGFSDFSPKRLFFAGCPENDLGDIPDQLHEIGFEVANSAQCDLEEGDHVIFCVLSSTGPTDGTMRSIRACAGREIVPVCIVMNSIEAVDDDSLIALVSMDHRNLLSEIMPEETLDLLPVFMDFDLNMPAKIAELLKNPPTSIRCK